MKKIYTVKMDEDVTFTNKKDFVNYIYELLVDGRTILKDDHYTQIYNYFSIRDNKDYFCVNGYGRTCIRATKQDLLFELSDCSHVKVD